MAVCIFCDGSGFSLSNGLCLECNGTGKISFDYADVIFEDDTEDIRSGEPFDLEYGNTISAKREY